MKLRDLGIPENVEEKLTSLGSGKKIENCDDEFLLLKEFASRFLAVIFLVQKILSYSGRCYKISSILVT